MEVQAIVNNLGTLAFVLSCFSGVVSLSAISITFALRGIAAAIDRQTHEMSCEEEDRPKPWRG